MNTIMEDNQLAFRSKWWTVDKDKKVTIHTATYINPNRDRRNKQQKRWDRQQKRIQQSKTS